MKIVRPKTEPGTGIWGAAGDQTQKQKSGGGDSSGASSSDAGGQKKLAKKGEDLKEEMDKVLEANAEEFVKNYVQRGGE